jgi:hypothetical protein
MRYAPMPNCPDALQEALDEPLASNSNSNNKSKQQMANNCEGNPSNATPTCMYSNNASICLSISFPTVIDHYSADKQYNSCNTHYEQQQQQQREAPASFVMRESDRERPRNGAH